jgi:2-keto-3-deoxy-L-rhamnonate aldolase RhmA
VRISDPKSTLFNGARSRQRFLGMMVSSTDPAIVDILGEHGLDFVMVDAEHGPIDVNTAQHHVRAAEASGMIPFIRVGENSPNLIGRFLDVGFQGVILPHVDTADEAQQLVRATQFAPTGVRGMCPANHAARYSGKDTVAFTEHAEREIITGVIIESPLGVANCAEIAAIDGIDLVFFGPGDLSHELGLRTSEGWENTLLRDAWGTVRDATKDAGKLLLSVTLADGTADRAGWLFDEGADLVLLEVDLLLFERMVERLVSEGRQESVAP